MADSVQTGGFGIPITAPQLDQESKALLGLKPLSFGSANGPLDIKPLAGWSVPSSHPELVSQGIATGLAAIGQNVAAAYVQKKKDVKEAEKEARKYEQDLALAKIRHPDSASGSSSQYNDLLKQAHITESQLRAKKLQEELDQGVAARVPRGMEKTAPPVRSLFKPIQDSRESTTPAPTTDAATPANEAVDEQIKAMPGAGSPGQEPQYQREVAPPVKIDQKPIGSASPFSSIQDGAQASAEPDLGNLSAALKDINPIYLQASATPGSVSVPPLPIAPQTSTSFSLSSPPPTLAQTPDMTQALAGLSAPIAPRPQQTQQQGQPQVTTEASPMPSATPQKQEVQSIPEFDRIIGVDKMMPEQDAIDLRNYARAKGLMEPEIKQSEHNPDNYKVIWPTITEQQKAKEHTQMVADKKDRDIQDIAMKRERIIMGEARNFGLRKEVSNFIDKSGPRSMLAPFISAYEAAKSNPQAAGESDVAMIDLYGRAMGGGKITQFQLEALKKARNLKDAYEMITGHPFTGQLTSQNIRDQMLRELVENVNIGADAANKVVTGVRRRLRESGIPEKQGTAFYFLGGHEPSTQFIIKDDALKYIKESKSKIESLHDQLAQAQAAGDATTEEVIKKQINGIKHRAQIFHDRLLDEAGEDSSLLGAKGMRDRNLEEGFGAGDTEAQPVYNTNP